VSPASAAALGQWIGKYVTVEGMVVSVRSLKGGVHIVQLQNGSAAPLTVFANRFTARNLNVAAWRPRTAVRAEGFVQRYKELVELALHYGTPR
jgi:DNA/RNA endonuclease YhcR with UshA esterase domain